eukprot:scpid14290/ scgid35050/ WD repeat-containing protein 66
MVFSSQDILAHGQAFPADASKMARRFAVPEFFVATRQTVVAKCTPLGRGKFEVLLREHSDETHCVAAHPFLHRIVTGSFEGYLRLWDYKRRLPLIDKSLGENFRIHTLAIDATGEYLGVGTMDGQVQVFAALDLTPQSPVFKMSQGAAIRHLAFSHDGQYLATSDQSRCVTVYHRPMETNIADFTDSLDASPPSTPSAAALSEGSRGSYRTDSRKDSERPSWNYLGKYRSHSKSIQGILFGVNEEDGEPRLFSVGNDRMLVEYDLAASVEDDLKIRTRDRIEQEAIPTCLAWYPYFSDQLFMMTANNEYKIKLYSLGTKMTRSTFQAKSSRQPIDKMMLLPLTDHETFSEEGRQERAYMLYAAHDELGLVQCPIDGNPFKYAPCIGHPGGIKSMAASYDGEYIFTAGGEDASIVMYKVNRQVIDKIVEAGGEGITPFYHCLPGQSRDTAWFERLSDYFYLTQIKVQRLDTQETLKIGRNIPSSEVPGILRAMGFYPTEYQIANMLNEIKYKFYNKTCLVYKDTVDMEDLIKLYINHLPVVGNSFERLKVAFKRIGKKIASENASTADSDDPSDVHHGGVDGNDSESDSTLNTLSLLKVLKENGEHVSEAEQAELMCYLFCHPEEYLHLPDDYKPGDAFHTSMKPEGVRLDVADVVQRIPEQVTAGTFAHDFLGMAQTGAMNV